MNSKVPKWMSPGPAVCFPKRSAEASQNETEEMERCKRPRTTLESEGDVEEFLVLLDRIHEMKKHLKRKRMNCSGSSLSAGGNLEAIDDDQMLVAIAGMPQAQGLSDAVDNISYNKSSRSPWKPSFEWEDFSINNSVSAQTELSGAAATKENKDGAGNIQIGNNLLETRCFLDRGTPAECSHFHVDDVNDKEDAVASPDLELQLFPSHLGFC